MPAIVVNAAVPQLQEVYPALVDTGATVSCVTQFVAARLQLQPKGKLPMQTASGLVDVNAYEVHLGFRMQVQGELQILGHPIPKQQEEIIAWNTMAPEFESGANSYQCIIGRDILRMGGLTLSHDGHYSFSY